jgi:anti-anti-sigma factor
MPTRITQIENAGADARMSNGEGKRGHVNNSDIESQPTVLKVEGTLHLRDAELLEKICRDVIDETGRPLTLDLESISFIDSDSASVLCRLKREQGVMLEGLHLFIGKVVELVEECEKAARYLPKAGDVT